MVSMEVLVVGCANAWAAPGNATSGYVVSSPAATVLLDCGHGVLARLREQVDPHDLDAVWLSHLHADHSADLISLAYMLRFHPHPRQGHRPRLFVPAGEHERLRRLGDAFGDADVFDKAFQVQEVCAGEPVIVGDMSLVGAWTVHPLPTLAVSVAVEGAKLTYGADSGPCPQLTELAAGCDVLLIEATLPEADEMHLSAVAAALIARQAGAGRCVLVHVCDAFDIAQVEIEASEAFGGPVRVARPGMRIPVTGR